jgi:hypothetical protein
MIFTSPLVSDFFYRTLLQAIEPVFPFSSFVLIEPLLSPAGSHHLRKLRELLVKGAYERRDVWPDRQHAMLTLKQRDRTKKWDPRFLEIFVVRIL